MVATENDANESLPAGHFCVGFLDISDDGKEFTEPRFLGCFEDVEPELNGRVKKFEPAEIVSL